VLSRGWQEDKADFNVQPVLDRALKVLVNMTLPLKVYQISSISARSASILHFSGSRVKYANFRGREGGPIGGPGFQECQGLKERKVK
jgi:hypothetical protein